MKIRYLKAYHGIQPGTVVDEHRPAVVKELTKWNVIDEKKGQRDRIAEPVPDSTPTTEELDKKAAVEQLAEDEAAAGAEVKKATKKSDDKKPDDKKPDDKKPDDKK